MRKLKMFRVALAAFSFLALTAAFVDFTGTAGEWFGWAAKMQFWPGVLALSAATIVTVVACTLLMGRVYCSVVCPLGIFQDVVIFLRRLCGLKFSREAESNPSRIARTTIRFASVIAFLSGGFLGLHFQWLEPYAIYGRAVSALLGPLVRMGNNAAVNWTVQHSWTRYLLHSVEVVFPPIAIMVMTVSVLAIIAALAMWKGRLWCNAVCPVGTMLGYTAKFSLMKIRIDSGKCVKCGLCSRACKTGSIDIAAGTIDKTKCIACFDCVASCGKGAVTWSK